MKHKSQINDARTTDDLIQEIKSLDADKIFVLCDSNTYNHCFNLIEPALHQREYHLHVIAPGEANKHIKTLESILESLAVHRYRKSDVLINLGGGMVSDIGGLAAGLYLRGMPYINIPTTLLAMVDAAHGGKTAVDFMGVKNLLGMINFPVKSIIHSGFLKSLPVRELRSGFVELLKHSLLSGDIVRQKLSCLRPEEIIPKPEIILQAAFFKISVTDRDPDDKGLRQILNLGHTIGHAIEAWSLCEGRQPMLHGEAIAFGLMAEMRIATSVTGLDPEFTNQMSTILSAYIHRPLPGIEDIDEIIEWIEHDKKNRKTEIKFSLLEKPGKAVYGIGISIDMIREAITKTLLSLSKL